MQTFLTYKVFSDTAKSLDYKRLGKQRVEAFQILKTLSEGSRWINHPAVQMWKGHEECLKVYTNAMIAEWKSRGYKNNMEQYRINWDLYTEPWWLGNEDFHRAMRSRLIEKLPEFYLPLFPKDKGFNDGKYLWPVIDSKTFKTI